MRMQLNGPNDRYPVNRPARQGGKTSFAQSPASGVRPTSAFNPFNSLENPFSPPPASTSGMDTFSTADIRSYFTEMGQAMGKTQPGETFSVSDLRKYERMLLHANELLDDTIRFSERAASPTEMFDLQKQDLAQRIGVTRAIQGVLQGDDAAISMDTISSAMKSLKGFAGGIKSYFIADKPVENPPANPFKTA